MGGRVTDPQGAVVRGAVVTVTSDDTGVERTSTTNKDGLWTVQLLLPGRYHFEIKAPGFRTEQRLDVLLQAADVKQFDMKLAVGSESQTVTVDTETPLIDTSSATSGTVVTRRELDDLPSQSHVPTLFATLAPGVVQRDQGSNVVRGWSNDGASQFTADGGRNNTESNNFQLDGMPDTKPGGDISYIPPMDSVQEFKVQTNAYDASIGRQAGATINMETRSGGKSYHGVLYEYNQNNFLNANLYQNAGKPRPPVHFNQFGGTFGGPVWIPKLYNGADRTFFFFSYDKTINTNPLSSTFSVPSALERQGDFSQSFSVSGGQTYKYQIYNPFQVDSRGNRQQFAGNVIPSNLISPIALKILAFVPLPNTAPPSTCSSCNNYVSPATRKDTFPVYSARVDQNWSNSQHSFVTASWSHLVETTDTWFQDLATGSNRIRDAKRLGIDHVWTMNASRILSMHYTLNRYEEPVSNLGAGYDPTQLGLPSSFTSQLQKPSFPYIKGIGGNSNEFGTSNAGNFNADTYHTWAATLTQIHKAHNLRFGAEFWIQQDAVANLGNQGEFDFNNSNWTRQNAFNTGGTNVGSSFAAFLLGLPNGGNVPVNASAFYSQHYIAGFVQDDWRLTPKLTLNLGLRWDLEQPVTERYNRLTSRFDRTAVNPITPSAQAAYGTILSSNASNPGVQLLNQYRPASSFQVMGTQLFAGVNGTPRSSINPDYHEWQPRAGFAYQLAPNTVLRGGFGRFTQASLVTGGQNGFSRSTSLVATQDNYLTPYDTLANPFRSGILAPTGSSLGALTNLGQGVDWTDPDLNRMYSWEYSLHLQQQYGGWLFEVGYSHNKTYDIPWTWNGNLPSYTLWKQLQQPVFDSAGRPVDILPWNTQVPNPFYQLAGVTGTVASSKTIAMNQLLNPFPLLGSMNETKPTGKNGYDALQTKIERRYHNGFSLISTFTWSKLFEDTAFLGPQIAGPTIEHKLGGEDRPFVWNITGIWDIPFGRGQRFGGNMGRVMNALIGGWELTGNYSASSGVPVVFGTDSFWSGRDASLGNQRTRGHWFDTTQFLPFPSKNTDISAYPSWTGVQSLPGASYKPAANDTIKNGVYQDFATYVRNYPTRWSDIRQQGVSEVTAGAYKNFKFTESMRLQVRFDAFNALNHPRFGAPDTNPNDATFGQVTLSQINQARTVELGAKLYY